MAETIPSYGSTAKPEHVEGTELPQISGKGWGRVKKFVSGQSKFPKSIFFIVGTEFCERFSYYGMKAVLILYLTNILKRDDNQATALYHIFVMLCYFTPMFGAMIADGLLGKYRTILYISLIYMTGNVVMCLTALPPQTTGHPYISGPLIGLILIAFGTGGIKPCVAAFGGDQIASDQTKSLQQFFAVFYFSINAGSVLSTFFTPIFRHDVQCFGNDCYALAFGVPAVLMFAALSVFFAGRSFYKIYPAGSNVVLTVFRATCRALFRKLTVRSTEPKEHWLDWAEDEFASNILQDIKDLYHVLKMYLLLPFFWALFDQQGSRWTLQAEHMDGDLGFYTIKPDQMQVLNPVLIIFLIPFFEAIVYPSMARLNIPTRPLARMCTGMFLAGVAFVIAGCIQLRIENSEILLPGDEQAVIKFVNAAPCDVYLKTSFYSGNIAYTNDTSHFTLPEGDYNVDVAPIACPDVAAQASFAVELDSRNVFSVIVYKESNQLKAVKVAGILEKARKGRARVSVGNFAESLATINDLNVTIHNRRRSYQFNVEPFQATDFKNLESGKYTVTVQETNSSGSPFHADVGQISVSPGGISRVLLQMGNSGKADDVQMAVYVDVQPNSVSMLWQVPQYVIITTGEILFSITGLEFSYSQAPGTMKSFVQAAWLMTVALGNLIIVIIAEAKFFESQAAEFFLFAALMGVVIFLFTFMAYCYTYITPSSIEDEGIVHDESLLIPNSREEEMDDMDGEYEEPNGGEESLS